MKDGTDEEYYKHTNKTIVDGNVINVYFIIMEGYCGDIDDDDSSFHYYYIIKSPSYPFTLQS